MKKLILLELLLLFLATTFQSDSPPGWYQQSLPVNDFVNDIFFLDSLNGWVGTRSSSSTDTGYILRTTNGGNNWVIQLSQINSFNSIQFLNINEGYAATGWNVARVFKTSDGGNNWFEVANFGLGFGMNDINFINKDTGWVSSGNLDFGGIWKTTDGGNNWVRQLAGSISIEIKAIYLLNKDTGWAVSSSSQYELYRTTNGGSNWNVQFTFGGFLNDVYFLNSKIGIITGGINRLTTDGGFSWTTSTQNVGGAEINFATDSIGWAGADFSKIAKTTNGGKDWYFQTSPIFSNISIAIFDTMKGWAAGTGIVKTTNGGITTSIHSVSEIPKNFLLYQNYPNPFNPKTLIRYKLSVNCNVTLKVYDLQGKEIITLINQRQSEGNHSVEFDAKDLTSGVYFYVIDVFNERNEKFSETKKMLLIK